THRVPYPPDKGDRIRCFNILRFLAARAEVHLACLADEPVHPDAEAALRRLCRQVAIGPLGRGRRPGAPGALASGSTGRGGPCPSPRLSRVLRGWAGQPRFDATLASSSSAAPYLMRPWLRAVPAVVDLMDVDSQKWLDYASSSRPPHSWLYRLEGTRLRRPERRLADRARPAPPPPPPPAPPFPPPPPPP